jgi:hypothetical protein
MAGNFFCQREWKSHRDCLSAEAKAEAGENTHGAFVAGAVSLRKRPGRKNDAGDTVVPALTPPQPPVKKGNGSNSIASKANFQFNLTSLVYRKLD